MICCRSTAPKLTTHGPEHHSETRVSTVRTMRHRSSQIYEHPICCLQIRGTMQSWGASAL
eukprot:2897193-Pyramimonas_sp.AAC.1